MEDFSSISLILSSYYSTKNTLTRIRQKGADLRQVVQTALERNRKKYDLQNKQLNDTKDREKYRIYGELINAYGYGLDAGSKELECLNYYTNEMMFISFFLELSCFFNDPVDVGSLISGFSACFKSLLNIWKFTVHVNLENFEHYFTSV